MIDAKNIMNTWFGNNPNKWKLLKLKYIVSKIDEVFTDESDLKIAVENIQGFTGKLIELEGFNYESQLSKFLKDDIVFNKLRPYLGKVYIADSVGGAFGELLILRVFNQEILPRFLFYAMINKKFIDLVDSSTTGAKMPRASWEDFIKQIAIPIPSFAQQNKIVDYLDKEVAKLDSLIEKKMRLVELLEEKKKASISQVVTKGLNPNVKMKSSNIDWLGDIPEHWEIKKLKYVLRSLNYIRIPLSAEERGLMSDKIYDYYGASGVIDKVEDYLFEEPLILVGEDGANLLSRNSRLVFIAEGKYWVNNHAHILKPLYGNLIYYCEMMETIDFSLWVSGSAQPKLTSENLMNIEIIVPPSNEQESISIYLEEINNKYDFIFEKVNNSINLLKEKRTAIISAAVNGEINL